MRTVCKYTHIFLTPIQQRPTAWNEWYQRWCGLRPAPLGDMGIPGTHQARWTDPAIKRDRSTSRGKSRSIPENLTPMSSTGKNSERARVFAHEAGIGCAPMHVRFKTSYVGQSNSGCSKG